jgi:crotonobetainyl-CoA:carnitine CoA-transferase CaiB-like acyl-CoA transferase
MLNAGKKSLMLDLKKASDRERLIPLLTRADVLVEQFRPGVMARFGLGYDDVAKLNPRLVYCSISGYGQSGPRAGEAGHDLNYIGNAGLLSLQAGLGSAPVVPPALIADIGGGSFPAVMNILLGLRQRDATGRGCHIDIAMTDALFTFAWYGLATGFVAGHFPGSGELALAGGSPRYQLYPTRDGKLVACAALEHKFWLAFCAAIGLSGPLMNDIGDPGATKAAVAKLIAARTAADWRPVLAAADCCATIVATLDEAVNDPHFAARGTFSGEVSGSSGKKLRALPVPIAPAFREKSGEVKKSPRLNADADSLSHGTGSAVQQSEVGAERQHAEEKAQPEHVGPDAQPKPLPSGHPKQRRRDRKQ